MPNSASPANRPQATTATATLGSGVAAAAAPMMAAARRRIRQHSEAAPVSGGRYRGRSGGVMHVLGG